MRKRSNAAQDSLFNARHIASQLLKALGYVILGEEPEQKIGVQMMIDCVKSDYMCAKRLLKVIDGTQGMAKRYPELRELCLQQTKGRV